MAVPPVLRADDWGGLLAVLAGRAGFPVMQSVDPQTAAAVLAAPAAIARWIAIHAPQLLSRPKLAVLVIGAESSDAPDQGRWYQCIKPMLEFDGTLEVTLLGAELDLSTVSAAGALAPDTSATAVRMLLADFLNAAHDRFDLAVLFQPGFQKHRGWLDASGIARLLAEGTLVMGSSYATDEYQMERWVLECYGYRVSSECVLNPHFLELGDTTSSIQWGRALWQIESAPPHGFQVDEKRLAALDLLNRMVLHSMRSEEHTSELQSH